MTLINTSASKMAKNEGISIWIKDSHHVYYKTVQNPNTLPIGNKSVFHYEFFASLALRSKSMILINRSKNKIARKVNIDCLVTCDRGNMFCLTKDYQIHQRLRNILNKNTETVFKVRIFLKQKPPMNIIGGLYKKVKIVT